MAKQIDSWDGGRTYEEFMGRWSHQIAHHFLDWLPVSSQKMWLDVGCGTGVLSKVILATKQPKSILAIDSSPKFIAFAQAENKEPRLQFEVGLAQNMPTASHQFDAVVSGLALNFVPQPELAVTEMKRVAKPGGTVAAYLWDYAQGMQMLRFFWDAAIALEQKANELDEGNRFPLCQEGQLEKLFVENDLHQVHAKAIEITTIFTSFEDYWHPFLGGVGPAPSYVMSLSESQRIALKEQLLMRMPMAADGTISLKARAWAVHGTT